MESQTVLENQKKKTWKSVKTKSQFVTHLELKGAFKAEKAERQERERENAGKEAQKAMEEAA